MSENEIVVKARASGKPIELTDRDVAILRDVADFGLMTRDQIRRQRRFGSVTRVNATLLRLVRCGYLSRRFQPTLTGWRRALYYVGPAGLEILSRRDPASPLERRRLAQLSDLFVEHQILVNETRLAFAEVQEPAYRFEQWTAEIQLRTRGVDVIPDGYVQYAWGDREFAAFVELDRGTESLSRWRQKTRAYLDFAFSGQYEAKYQRRFFRVLAIALSPRRLANLQREIAKQTEQIFWLTTMTELLQRGPLACIWHRPNDARQHALIES